MLCMTTVGVLRMRTAHRRLFMPAKIYLPVDFRVTAREGGRGEMGRISRMRKRRHLQCYRVSEVTCARCPIYNQIRSTYLGVEIRLQSYTANLDLWSYMKWIFDWNPTTPGNWTHVTAVCECVCLGDSVCKRENESEWVGLMNAHAVLKKDLTNDRKVLIIMWWSVLYCGVI